MSLVFKPKIPVSFKLPVQENKIERAQRMRKYWTPEELDVLISLRALGVSLKEIATVLSRRPETIGHKIHTSLLYSEITAKRKQLINEVLGKYNDRKTDKDL